MRRALSFYVAPIGLLISINHNEGFTMENSSNLPFFARFLDAQEIEQVSGAASTMKYPSDSDEDVTMKYPSDSDELSSNLA